MDVADLLTDEYLYLAAAHRDVQGLVDRHRLTDAVLVEVAAELVTALTEADEWGALIDALGGDASATPVADAFLAVWPSGDQVDAARLLGIIAGTWCPDPERIQALAIDPDRVKTLVADPDRLAAMVG